MKAHYQTPKFTVVTTETQAIVRNNRTQKQRIFCKTEFIYGQGMYNPITEAYPNYVHAQVWR